MRVLSRTRPPRHVGAEGAGEAGGCFEGGRQVQLEPIALDAAGAVRTDLFRGHKGSVT